MSKNGRESSHSHLPARKGGAPDPDHRVAFPSNSYTPQKMQRQTGSQQTSAQQAKGGDAGGFEVTSTLDRAAARSPGAANIDDGWNV